MSAEVEVDMKKGICKFKGTKMEILCVETGFYVDILKSVEEFMGTPAKLFTYNLGKRHNKEMYNRWVGKHFWANLMVGLGKRISPRMALRKSLEFAKMTGFGSFKLDSYSPKKRVVFTSPNSTIARVYGKASSPVCLFVAGLLAGGCELLFGGEWDCVEEKCLAIGDSHCEFVCTPASME